ncbi:zinc ribbon domain-containing protein [Chloroflexota bacterium]
MRCSECRKDIDEEVFPPPLTYCPYCGLKLKDGGADETEGMHFCPHCGKELPGKVGFCPYCGGSIGKRVTTYHGLEGIEPTGHGAKSLTQPPQLDRKTQKLYRQWTKYAELPQEAVPTPEPTQKPVVPAKMRDIPILYIVIGLCIVVLFVLITVVLVQSC